MRTAARDYRLDRLLETMTRTRVIPFGRFWSMADAKIACLCCITAQVFEQLAESAAAYGLWRFNGFHFALLIRRGAKGETMPVAKDSTNDSLLEGLAVSSWGGTIIWRPSIFGWGVRPLASCKSCLIRALSIPVVRHLHDAETACFGFYASSRSEDRGCGFTDGLLHLPGTEFNFLSWITFAFFVHRRLALS